MVKFENIPEELQLLDQWVLWRKVPTEQGKITKEPFQMSGRKAASTRSAEWGSFQEIRSYYLLNQESYDGIGFVFTSEDPYVGIDYDGDTFTKGSDNALTLNPEVAAEVDLFDTYTEFSQSGMGLHCIAKLERGLPLNLRNKKKDKSREVYDTQRYFVFTGNIFDGHTTINTRDGQVNDFLIRNEMFRTPAVQDDGLDMTYDPSKFEGYTSKDELLTIIRRSKSADSFDNLYVQGDLVANHNDHSSADFALLSKLAFWTGGNPALMDEMFRESALMRPKWDEKHGALTYGDGSIKNVLRGCTEFYTPNRRIVKEAKGLKTAPMIDRHNKNNPETFKELFEYLDLYFRLNDLDDTIMFKRGDVDWCGLDDVQLRALQARLRGYGISVDALWDNINLHALKNRFHPIKDYLTNVEWDGQDHIHRVTKYFTNPDKIFGFLLKKWLVGAVSKAFDGETQNPVLVLDGPQHTGKSYFTKWLCTGVGLKYLRTGKVLPNNKDHFIYQTNKFIWEISELGATTGKANREDLKDFLTTERVSERAAYNRMDTTKPSLVSYIGTVNDESGFLSDPTGSRRFRATEVTEINWDYARDIDPNQLWAQAMSLYKAGVTVDLTIKQEDFLAIIKEKYKTANALEDLIAKEFEFVDDESEGLSSGFLIDYVKTQDYKYTNDNILSKDISSVMTGMGARKGKVRGMRGYRCIKRKR